MSNLKISVITPSFNQAQFLPFNLTSVASQKSVNVEHIIVDPGSTDGSTELARKSPNIKLIAEPDRGQSDGICKGFSQSTGDILVWLNSDDFYPNQQVLFSVLKCFEDNPDVDIVYGDVNFVDESGNFLRKGFVNKDSKQLLDSFEYQVGIVQPGVFWRRRVFEEIGGPSEEFEYCMDYELWVRMAANGYKWKYLPKVLAHHRWWSGMKTSSHRDLSLREHFKVCDRYFGYVHWKWLDRYADFLCSNQDGVVNHAKSIDQNEKEVVLKKVIDEIVTQEMLYKLTSSNRTERIKTLKFINEIYPEKQRFYYCKDELQVISEASDDPKAKERVAWNIFEVDTSDKNQFVSYHVPNNFNRYFDKKWHQEQLKRAKDALRNLGKEKLGDTCIIVGNGPSLLKSDLSLLEGFDTIVSNFASLSPDLVRYAKILTVVNDLVAKQGAIDFNASEIIKFVPFWLANYFNQNNNTFFVNASVRPEFSSDFVQSASWRSTVSFFNMQLAYAIGYKKVILIGFDNSYVQSKKMTEGMLIKQTDDDENHFDPRYFKGKDWQAADTENMEKMYLVAKEAYEKDGREIVNCTVGGKLEIFRRADLAKELGIEIPPKLLMIDSTPIGHRSATGQLKLTFLGDWPSSSFLQIWKNGSQPSTLHSIKIGQSIKDSQKTSLSNDEILEKCKLFNPEIIYFRPIDSESLFELVDLLTSKLSKPLIIHMMDDWPERLRRLNSKDYSRYDSALRSLLARSALKLSICDRMSDEYSKRYGGEWLALANGADLNNFPLKDLKKKYKVTKSSPFVIRYMGALADDMTFESVKDIAKAVSFLQKKLSVRFEIYTMDWCIEKAQGTMKGFSNVTVFPLVDEKDYHSFLSDSDALVIAYNFDPESINYIGLSLANKLPECLAPGVPLLAYGPEEVATIDFLKKADCAQLVNTQKFNVLCEAIEKLVTSPEYCKRLASKAQKFVSENLTKQQVQERFLSLMMQSKNTLSYPVIGPYTRDQLAHYDETDCIAELYDSTLSGKVMIDVGAHHGWALLPFLKKDWKVFAFEPDNNNREKLLEQLAKHKNSSLVNIDTRCVSNESQKNISFFTSEQSTGISGLSAFHETHVEAQHVDTTTLTDFFQGKPMPVVDFLKIDTEGHDLFVLQGYPWGKNIPNVVECEFEDTKTVPLGYTFHDIAQFLVNKGYTVYVSEWHPIIRYGIRHNWNQLSKYPCELSDKNAWGNLLAFKEPIDEEHLINAVNKVLTIEESKKAEAPTQNILLDHSIDTNLNIRDANTFYRQGNYTKAMESYLQLYQLRKLKMYANNALMTAGKLGITSINSIDELIQHVVAKKP